MKTLRTAVLALTLAGCAAAAAEIPPSSLGVTARDGFLEARTVARVWDADARLRYVEGLGIGPAGLALPDAGEWRFHYTAPGHGDELLVRVKPLETVQEERPATSPPGYVIGDNALDEGWVDSPQVMAAVQAEGGDLAGATLLLVPTRPPRWVVRAEGEQERWQVDANTGGVIGR